MLIDVHTHAFPDSIAERAVPLLAEQGNVKAWLDGKITTLLASMDRAGIAKSVVCSIATKPGQFGPILKWSQTIASDRLIPLGSVHPSDPEAMAHVRAIRDTGLKGIKLHPYHQGFDLDEERLMPIYEAIADCGLVLIMHTGFDVGFPRVRKADPGRILNVFRRFPSLKFVVTHLGAWEDWDEVKLHLLGLPLYMDLSCALEFMSPEQARAMIMAHPADRMLFGSDSPWNDQAEVVARVRALDLPADRLERILGSNAVDLFGLG
jgi:uncharacterized protein